MRGYSVDIELLSEFLQNQPNDFALEELVSKVKSNIQEIDDKLAELKSLSLKRDKLQNFLIYFENNKNEINKDLVLFEQISNFQIAKKIIKLKKIYLSNLSLKEQKVLNELLICKILENNNNHYIHSHNYNKFLDYLNAK